MIIYSQREGETLKGKEARTMAITNYEEINKIEENGVKTTLTLERTDRDGWPEKYTQKVYAYNGKYYRVETDRDGWPIAYEVRVC